MWRTFIDFAKSKEGRNAALALGFTIGALTAVHYYNQIKLARLKIKSLEKKNED